MADIVRRWWKWPEPDGNRSGTAKITLLPARCPIMRKFIATVIMLSVLFIGTVPGYPHPMAPAAAPYLPKAKVISIYNSSITYTNVPVANGYFNNWYNPGGKAGVYNIITSQPVTNAVLLYSAPVTVWGIDFTGNPENIEDCDHIHVDVYSPTAKTFYLRLMNTSSQTANASAEITNGVWTGLDIPLSAFSTNNPNFIFCNISAIGIIGDGTVNSTYYIDNIYFASVTNLGSPLMSPTNPAPKPTCAQNSILAIYNSSNTYTNGPDINFNPWGSAASVGHYTIPGTTCAVLSYLGLSYYGIDLNPYYDDDGNGLNISAYDTFHADVWTSSTSVQLGVKLVSTDNGAAPLVYYPASGVLTNGQWVSLDIPLTAFTSLAPNLDLNHLDQMLWYGNNGNFYIDNVYFYKQLRSIFTNYNQ
jgi:hypothetical protein